MIRPPFDTAQIGAWLGGADDHQQSDFFNSFGMECPIICKATDGNYDIQLCCLVKLLTPSGRKIIKDLAEHVEIREEQEGLGS